jgi:hypothetical protein
MLYRDCTGKKVVPTIARGVKLGEGGESLTPHFRHGAKSSAGPAALPGISDSRRENTDPNEVFEHQLSLLRRSDKKFVKKTGDRPSLYNRARWPIDSLGHLPRIAEHFMAVRQRYREPLRVDPRTLRYRAFPALQ